MFRHNLRGDVPSGTPREDSPILTFELLDRIGRVAHGCLAESDTTASGFESLPDKHAICSDGLRTGCLRQGESVVFPVDSSCLPGVGIWIGLGFLPCPAVFDFRARLRNVDAAVCSFELVTRDM